MKIAVKFQSQNNGNKDGVPSYWPWKRLTIEDSQAEDYEANGFTIYTEAEFEKYIEEHQAAYGLWASAKDSDLLKLKVIGLVEKEFENFHPSKIDFRRHLKPNIYLQKKIFMLKNGRPNYAEYYYEDVKICEIKFEFTTNPLNFMTRRTEKLGWVNQAGDIETYWIIHDQQYSTGIATQFSEMVKERTEARTIIFEEVRAILGGFLASHYMGIGWTYQQVLQLGGLFWTAHSALLDAWVKTGTPDLKTAIEDDDFTEFLDLEIPAIVIGAEEPMTVREYIIDRITY